MDLYRVQVTIAWNNKSDLYIFARIPVVGDHLILDCGMFKVIEVRMYYFKDRDKDRLYYDCVAHVIVEERKN